MRNLWMRGVSMIRFTACLLLVTVLGVGAVLVADQCLVQAGLKQSARAPTALGTFSKETADSVLMVERRQSQPVEPTRPVSASESSPTAAVGGSNPTLPSKEFEASDWRTHRHQAIQSWLPGSTAYAIGVGIFALACVVLALACHFFPKKMFAWPALAAYSVLLSTSLFMGLNNIVLPGRGDAVLQRSANRYSLRDRFISASGIPMLPATEAETGSSIFVQAASVFLERNADVRLMLELLGLA